MLDAYSLQPARWMKLTVLPTELIRLRPGALITLIRSSHFFATGRSCQAVLANESTWWPARPPPRAACSLLMIHLWSLWILMASYAYLYRVTERDQVGQCSVHAFHHVVWCFQFLLWYTVIVHRSFRPDWEEFRLCAWGWDSPSTVCYPILFAPVIQDLKNIEVTSIDPVVVYRLNSFDRMYPLLMVNAWCLNLLCRAMRNLVCEDTEESDDPSSKRNAVQLVVLPRRAGTWWSRKVCECQIIN